MIRTRNGRVAAMCHRVQQALFRKVRVRESFKIRLNLNERQRLPLPTR